MQACVKKHQCAFKSIRKTLGTGRMAPKMQALAFQVCDCMYMPQQMPKTSQTCYIYNKYHSDVYCIEYHNSKDFLVLLLQKSYILVLLLQES